MKDIKLKTNYKFACIKTEDSIEIIEVKNDFDKKIKKYENTNIEKIVYGNSFMELENILNDDKTFYEKLIDNEIKIDDIDFYIENWKNGNSEKTIYEYLGLTDKQYEIYKKQGIIHI